jgi:hypothetical protein
VRWLDVKRGRRGMIDIMKNARETWKKERKPESKC